MKQFKTPIEETFMWADSKKDLSYLQNKDCNF